MKLLLALSIALGASVAAHAGTCAITNTSPLTSKSVGATGTVYLAQNFCSASTWTVTSGSLPPGATLDPSTGQIAYTMTTGGTYNFTIAFSTASTNFQWVITGSGGTCAITTTSPLGPKNVGDTASVYLAQNNCTGNWSVSSGSLPPGTSLAPTTGLISGAFTTAGTYSFTIGVGTASTAFTWVISGSGGTSVLTSLNGIQNQTFTVSSMSINGVASQVFDVSLGIINGVGNLTISQGNATNPTTSQSFTQAITSMGLSQFRDYEFGTAAGRNVQNTTQLATSFGPYSGAAGTQVINSEWERYQPFSSSANFVFTTNTLNLTATIPSGGGLFAGGINSGQIWTKETFRPTTLHNTTTSPQRTNYAFEVNMQIPAGNGMWPAAWLYSAYPSGGGLGANEGTDGSEIDIPEVFVYNQGGGQDTRYISMNAHGPNVGSTIYDVRNSSGLYYTGTDFSLAMHKYQCIFTPTRVYKYIDGVLVWAYNFVYSSGGDAQYGVNLATGSDNGNLPQVSSTGEFPAALKLDHIQIWGN